MEGGQGEGDRERLVQVLGVLDPCHAAVLLQRSRQRYRSRVADVLAAEAARRCNSYHFFKKEKGDE